MSSIRSVLGLLGLVAVGYGASLLLERSEDLVHVAIWLGTGIVLHDAVIAPATSAVGVLARRILGGPLPGPVVAGAVVLATVTLAAVPVLGRFGARPDNPTLLDRDYTTGWLVVVAIVSTVVLGSLTRRRRRRTDLS